jgi:hypothetical protein
MNRNREVIATLVSEILRLIDSFTKGELPIDRLSADLKGMLAVLDEHADHVWVEELRTQRNQIEVVNAVMQRARRTSMTDVELSEVRDAVLKMRQALVFHEG